MPQLDLSNSLVRAACGDRAHALLEAIAQRYFSLLRQMYRIAAALFIVVFFVEPAQGVILCYLCLPLSLPTLLVTTGLLGVDMATLMVRNHEFWFVSSINLVAWVLMGVILGDFRISVCFTTWLALQSTILIDANSWRPTVIVSTSKGRTR